MRKSKHFARYRVFYGGTPPYSIPGWETAHETEEPYALDYLTGALLAEVLAGEYMALKIEIVIYHNPGPTFAFVDVGALAVWRRVRVEDTNMIRPVGAPPINEVRQARIHMIDKANITLFLDSDAGALLAGRTRQAALAIVNSEHVQLTNTLAHWFANWQMYGGQWQEQVIQDLIVL